MEQYIVTGMSCAACSARVEKAVCKVPGVTGCAVNLLTGSMGVEGTARSEDIILAVEKAGYGAVLRKQKKEEIHNIGANTSQQNKKGQEADFDAEAVNRKTEEEIFSDNETLRLKKRLVASLGFLAVLMYISMGHVMWGWPLPKWMAGKPTWIAALQFLLTIIVMLINRKFFVNGLKGLLYKAPNMDTLVALGSGAAFGYSTVVLGMMTIAQTKGNGMEHYLHELYFESAAMILTLITLGKMLEARSKGKTTDALKGLMKLAPKMATLIIHGQEQEVPIEQVQAGDIFVLRPGSRIPVDGEVVEGSSAVDESALTGESIPVDKAAGDKVSAGTLNQSGYLRCEATRVGEDTTLAQIIQMVSDGAATKAPIAKVADKVSGIFVPVVLLIALLTCAAWLLAGESPGFALARSISVLVISCPCALGLATPVAIMVGSGVGARHGILFKTAASLEETGKARIVVLDKTGTLTMGEPKVTDIVPAEDVSEEELLKLAYLLEKRSEHPLAKAIVREAENRWYKNPVSQSEALDRSVGEEGVRGSEEKTPKMEANSIGEVPFATLKETKELTDFQALPGNGLTALLEGKELCGGNLTFLKERAKVPEQEILRAEVLAQAGKNPIYFAYDGRLLGIIGVADTLKEDSPRAVQELRQMGLQVVMLTGDNEKTALAIAKEVGVDRVIAGVLPEGKERTIRELQMQGKVIMVGDGINDAPALVAADMGIAIGAGTDVAVDAAEVVLMKNSLRDVAAAIRLSRSTLRNIRQNLFWAFFYNSIGIPLAAGVFIPVLGWQLSPMFGAAAMSLSSFCVVSNALRLNLCKLYGKAEPKPTVTQVSETQAQLPEKQTKGEMCTKDLGCSSDARPESAPCTDGAKRPGEGDVSQDLNMGEAVTGETKRNTKIESEEKTMERTLKIEGMMCGHCEARVKKVLEALEQVEDAVVSHVEGTAIVALKQPISDEELTKVIEDQDYKVLQIL